MSKFNHLFRLIGFLTLGFILSSAGIVRGGDPPEPGELLIRIVDENGNLGSFHDIEVDAFSTIWGLRVDDYPVTSAYDHEDTLDDHFFLDHIESPAPNYILFGYGYYRIRVNSGGSWYHIFADFRDCDYGNGDGPGTNYHNGDMPIRFDEDDNIFSWRDVIGNWHLMNNGESISIWALRKTPPTPRHFCFEGIDPPTQNNITTENNHPKINWTYSFTPNGGPSLSKFNVYRKKAPSGPYGKIGTVNWDGGSNYSFVDETVVVQGGMGNPFTARYAVTNIWNEANLDMESGKSNTKDIVVRYDFQAKRTSLSAQIRKHGAEVNSYPNPFNPSTTISYNIPSHGKVSLKIYDIMGREIIVLKDGNETAGRHIAKWSGKDKYNRQVASGMYFYQLIFEGKRSTGKLSLMR